MDQIPKAGPGQVINLAHVQDFAVGAMSVQPSLRRVSAGGFEALVEPRVMQALIALAEAGETVVSRDTLIDRCWGGRIVGDDAINRCIAKIRKLAQALPPSAFSIETVAKVGYRLKAMRIPSAPAARVASSSPPTSSVLVRQHSVALEWKLPALGAVCLLVIAGAVTSGSSRTGRRQATRWRS